MPVENLEQPVVLRTDREAGMALVKSKDGRVKWLTVRYKNTSYSTDVSKAYKQQYSRTSTNNTIR